MAAWTIACGPCPTSRPRPGPPGGGAVRCLQLARNEWDPGLQRSRTKVLYNFGREDELDREASSGW